MPRKNVSVYVEDGADVQLFFDGMILFMFSRKGSKTVNGHAVEVPFAEKIAIKAICLSRYIECLDECEKDYSKQEECKKAYEECIASPDGFAKHAEQVYKKFLGRINEKGG